MEQSKEKSSVCRVFYEKFPLGKERRHKELVSFLINHPSSRVKLEEWIGSQDQKGIPRSMRPTNDYDDPSPSQFPEAGSSGAHPVPAHPANGFSKCNVISKKERLLGNDFYIRKKLWDSLRHYNQAIKFSNFPKPYQDNSEVSVTDEPGSDDPETNCFTFALANRSAVFYELGESFYEKALKDIDLAVKFGYPDRLKIKLIIRKGDIFTKQGKTQAAKECYFIMKARQTLNKVVSYQDYQEAVGSNDLPIRYLEESSTQINDVEKQMGALLRTDKTDNSTGTGTTEKNEGFNENNNFESASDHVAIRTSEALGRHVIAMTNLSEGDVLFKEQPFASVLLPEFYDSHCHHCHKLLYGQAGDKYFFPCSRCTQVLFCDDLCAEAAACYHVHECGWLDLLHSVGIAHLALRIILVAGVENVLHCAAKHADLSDLTNVEIFKRGMNNYHRVYSLVDHISDMFEEDLFQYTLTASLLTRFLITQTSFLYGVSEEEQLLIGGTLLRHICQLVCNAHAVTSILPDDVSVPSAVIDECQKRIATAIFPAASIMNHSCDSNIMFYFVDGKQLIVKAARMIENGENVYNCYGPHFRRMQRNERQEILLQQYFFTCNCDMCNVERKDEMSFTDQFQALQCEKCKEPVYLSDAPAVPCLKCGRDQNMKVKIEILNAVCGLQKKGEYFLEQGNIEAATEAFQSCYTSASQILYKYNSQYGQICDSLARCSVMTGKLKKAKKLLEQSLEYVEVRFGKNSVEYIKESQKYREVCAEC